LIENLGGAYKQTGDVQQELFRKHTGKEAAGAHMPVCSRHGGSLQSSIDETRSREEDLH
jgi:hypothetical protein